MHLTTHRRHNLKEKERATTTISTYKKSHNSKPTIYSQPTAPRCSPHLKSKKSGKRQPASLNNQLNPSNPSAAIHQVVSLEETSPSSKQSEIFKLPSNASQPPAPRPPNSIAEQNSRHTINLRQSECWLVLA